MMSLLSRLTLTHKIMLINVIVVLAALMLATAIFIAVERTAVRDRVVRELLSQAQIVSYNVAAAVAFQDEGAANEILSSFQAIPQIMEAMVFHQDTVLARYRAVDYKPMRNGFSAVQSGRVNWASDRAEPGVVFSDEGIFVFTDVSLGGESIGSLYMQASLAQFNEYKQRAALIAGLVLLSTGALALFLIARMVGVVSRPIERLTQAVTAVAADNNYRIRVRKEADDELGVLTEAFNAMLIEIGRRDEALHHQQLELEHQVKERTSDLVTANLSLEETVRALQQANRAIRISEESKRMAEASAMAKTQFLANMSHELRTPMNGVLGMLSLLSETELNDSQSRYVRVAYESGSLLLELLNNVLDLSKIEQGKMALERIAFDVVEAIEDVNGILGESAFGKGVELALMLDRDAPSRVMGDPVRFKQILFNLVGNAIKFTAQGHVVIRYQMLEQTDRGLRFRFAVEDTGIGIPADVQELIFGTFSQADSSTTRNFGGTGLGLALCRQLVHLMSGRIGVESEPGVGSLFWFEVLLGKSDDAGPVAVQREATGDLLQLDANDTSARNLRLYLERSGFAVERARDYDELYRLLDARVSEGGTYTGLLVNLALGVEAVVEVLQTEDVHCCLRPEQIILYGSLAMRNEALKRDSLKAYGFLAKPIRQRDVESLAARFNGEAGDLESVPATVTADTGWSQCRVLVVEDNQINQQVIAGRLERMGCQVRLVNNGQQALDALVLERYDLIFMDCQMPVMDGFQTALAIRQREAYSQQHVPIIAMTAHALSGDREACMRAGMDDYISKPFNASDLHQVLNRWLRPVL